MNPCQTCGACCASFRVSFPADEMAGEGGGTVPEALCEPFGNVACMRTKVAGGLRCIALRGEIGVAADCAIYEFRPSSCREFAPLAVLGRGDSACDEARRRHGLAVLIPDLA